MLSDFNKEFGQAYDLATTNPAGLRGMLRRSVFVIQPDGIIAFRWDNTDPPSLPRADDILAEVRRIVG
jgi:glutaredoxin-dependent peroxiredoxin